MMHHLLLWLTIAFIVNLLTLCLLLIKSLPNFFLCTNYHLCLVGLVRAVSPAFFPVVKTDLLLDDLIGCQNRLVVTELSLSSSPRTLNRLIAASMRCI